MIMRAPAYGLQLEFKECMVNVLVVENEELFADITQSLWKLSDDIFTVEEGDKTYNIGKVLECIINPFAIDCNDKRLLTKMYLEMKEETELLLQSEELNFRTNVINYIEQVCNSVNYELDFNYNFDIVDIFKTLGIRFSDEYDSLLEQIISYLRLKKRLLDVSVFVLVNIKQYLCKDNLEELYKMAFYEKIHIVLIEASEKEILKNERITIVDKDLCIINLD